MCRNIWQSVLHLDCNERWLLVSVQTALHLPIPLFSLIYSFVG